MQHPVIAQIPRVIGHRGAMGSAPENTLASLRRAAELGARWVEFDVGLAACGELVLFHDDDLSRITGHGAELSQTPFAVLRELDAGGHFHPDFLGEGIPTLTQSITLLAELGLGANLEVKVPDALAGEAVAALAPVLTAQWPAGLPLLLSSFSLPVLEALRDRLPEWPRGYLVEALPEDWLAEAQRLEAVSVHAWDEPLTQQQAESVIAAGYPLLVYTVNDRERAAELFGWGVTAVFCDHPERLLDLT